LLASSPSSEGKLSGATIFTFADRRRLARLRVLAIAAAFGGEIHDDAPDFMPATCFC